jgi:hypothetical protein
MAANVSSPVTDVDVPGSGLSPACRRRSIPLEIASRSKSFKPILERASANGGAS